MNCTRWTQKSNPTTGLAADDPLEISSHLRNRPYQKERRNWLVHLSGLTVLPESTVIYWGVSRDYYHPLPFQITAAWQVSLSPRYSFDKDVPAIWQCCNGVPTFKALQRSFFFFLLMNTWIRGFDFLHTLKSTITSLTLSSLKSKNMFFVLINLVGDLIPLVGAVSQQCQNGIGIMN